MNPSDQSGPCIEYNGYCLPSGYGVLGLSRGARDYAHRLAYRLFVGPIPRGMYVCHHCDNPRCINPAHLFVGTAADNHLDCETKGRAKLPPLDVAGEKNPRAVLRASDVDDIRATADAARRPGMLRFRRGAGLVKALAVKYGVSQAMVRNVIQRRSWK